MCVIAIVDEHDKRPSAEEISAMWEQNPQGGGMAWRDGEKVFWKKGLNLGQMQRFMAELPVPYVAHFRISSCGDGGIPKLTHPFLIEKDAPLILEGSTKTGQVLFHNGHWSDWQKMCKLWLSGAAGKIKIPKLGPDEKWSDTRAMAFWAYYFGIGIFDGEPWGINEKVVVMGPPTKDNPDGIDVFGHGWSVYHGYTISNDYWIKKLPLKGKLLKMESTQPVPRREVLGLTSGSTTGSTSTSKPSTATSSSSAESEIHPYHRAREEYETACAAYHLHGGGPQGSKNQMKKKRKEYEKMMWRYPQEHQEWKNFQAMMEKQATAAMNAPLQSSIPS